jgi:hypothetical protein
MFLMLWMIAILGAAQKWKKGGKKEKKEEIATPSFYATCLFTTFCH